MKITIMFSILVGVASISCCKPACAQDGPMDSDKNFIMAASQSDLTEIKLSQLALQNSSNPKIKEFAQKMINDHTMLSAKMKPFAEKMGVPPAVALNDKHQAQYDELKDLSIAAFDKAYTKDMDINHNMALMAFQAELATTKMSSESDFITTVASGEVVVAMHTRMADKMEKDMGLPVIDPASL